MLPTCLIATALGRPLEAPTVTGLLGATALGLCQGWIASASSDIAYNRDLLVHKFLTEHTSDRLLFLDSDVAFTTQDLEKILSRSEDVVAGAYPRKRFPLGLAYATLEPGTAGKGELVTLPVRDGCLMKVWGVGMGFTMLSRSCLLKMTREYETLRTYVDAKETELVELFPFETVLYPDGKRRREGEDYGFCRLWQRLGGEVFVHLDLNIGHVGNHTYQGVTRELLGAEQR